MDEVTGTPNFSVILPGKCNCKCDFCFWKYEKSPEQWLENLSLTIKNLPQKYTRCSVSGGEPTLSPVFDKVFDSIASQRKWDAIVLTTNGTKLIDKIESISKINHLNLSRHHFNEKTNLEIFKTKSLPQKNELKKICNKVNSMGIDVNLNCVLQNQFANKEEIEEFIRFAKEIESQTICFRQDQSLNSTEMPQEMKWFNDIKIIPGWSCEACKIVYQYINGMRITWKAAIAEPSKKHGKTYELIYNQNGNLTDDWQGKNIINVIPSKTIEVIKYQQSACGGTYIPSCGEIPSCGSNNNRRRPSCGGGSSNNEIPSCGGSNNNRRRPSCGR